MSAAVIVPVDTEALEFEILPWPDKARALAVVDQATCNAAGEFLKGIKALGNEIDTQCDPNIARWYEGHRSATTQKRELKAPLVEAETIIKRAIATWMTEQERQRQEEQRRLREIARKEEEERRVAEALELEIAGEHEMAQETLTLPTPTPTIELPKPVSAPGVTMRETWKAEVTDLRALCRAIGAGTVPVECVKADLVTLNRLAVSLKRSMDYPGVRAVVQQTVAAKAR